MEASGEVDGDGDEPPANIDGDEGDGPRVSRAGRPRSIRRSVPLVAPLALCFLVATGDKFAHGHGGYPEPHVDTAGLWKGANALAGMALVRWIHHANADVRTVPDTCRPYCLEAQAQVRSLITGFVYYEVVEVVRTRQWPTARQVTVSALHGLASAAEWIFASGQDAEVSMAMDSVLESWQEAHEIVPPMEFDFLHVRPFGHSAFL